MMVIRGAKPERNFTIICNALLRDERLSFRARGVLVYVLSFPDGFQVSSDRLADVGKEGRDAIRTAFAELEAAGYLVRQKRQGLDGKWETNVVISDEPTEKATDDGFPGVGFPGVGKPGVGFPGANTKTSVSKDTEKKKSVAALPHIDRPDDIEPSIWCDFIALRNKKKAVVTATAVIGLRREAGLAGWSMDDALIECCARGWTGFNHKWVATDKPAESAYARTMREKYEVVAPVVAARNPSARINPNTYFDQPKERTDAYIN